MIRKLASLRVLPVLLAAVVPAGAAEVQPLDWVLAYVMSYDNNLDHCAPVINGELAEGLVKDNVAVVVLVDRLDHEGLERLVLRQGNQERIRLETEDLCDAATLREHLAWVAQRFPARRYGLIFLDHGGRLDQMCLDRHPRRSRQPAERWMSARQTAATIRAWSGTLTEGRLELLFLQQCGRGSLENLYSFRGTAPYVLASQTVVGAPNTYYAEAVQLLSETPATDGRALAEQIMAVDEHYTSYVLVDGQELERLAGPAAALVAALQGDGVQRIRPEVPPSPCFQLHDEANHDLLAYLERLASARGVGEHPAVSAFAGWVREHLILAHRYRHERHESLGWCGLSMHVPASPAGYERYAELPVYRDTRWGDLARDLAGVQEPAPEPESPQEEDD